MGLLNIRREDCGHHYARILATASRERATKLWDKEFPTFCFFIAIELSRNELHLKAQW